DTSRNNQSQQQPPKRNNVARAYTAGSGEKKLYGGFKPQCPKCNYHYDGQCAPKCGKCHRVGHLSRDYKRPANPNNDNNNQRAPRAITGLLTCYECGDQGHFKRECPRLRNIIHENQAEGTKARGMVYALGGGETNQDPNNIEDEIEA
ncbi:hypothetical protein Tco_0985015, partial [Tanacetum coccineum]